MSAELCAHQHAVQFYENDVFLCDAVSSFVAEGLAASQPIIIISTPAHHKGISDRLPAYGFEFDRVHSSGQLMHLDATETLALFMRDGMPDAELFSNTVGRIVGERLQAHRSSSVRAYGEMVDVLWRAGNAAGALRLEELWNELAERYSFSLLCAYSIANFYKVSDADYFDRICATHSRVIPTEAIALLPDEGEQSRHVAMLQQRTLALTAELEKAHRAKADFLAVMSHELRTPLNAIIGYDDLLEHEVGGPTTDAQKHYIGRIRDGADRLMQLIDQVLSLSRIEAGEEEVSLGLTDIGSIIEEAVEQVEPIAAARGLHLENHGVDFRVMSWTDAGKIRQIMLNLLSNAVKFTSAGTISVHATLDNSLLTVQVADTGVGIDEADVDRIFDSFVQVDASSTRKFGGCGAGLSVSRNFARILGGELSVSSQPGVGSAFTLQLPLRAAPDSLSAPQVDISAA